ncbi:hypothetical protein XENTR_v10000018 [Xenopus tropicalis]|nr:hypothetical protein XENTR_v10000018 [Xenopus tropicalis]
MATDWLVPLHWVRKGTDGTTAAIKVLCKSQNTIRITKPPIGGWNLAAPLVKKGTVAGDWPSGRWFL